MERAGVVEREHGYAVVPDEPKDGGEVRVAVSANDGGADGLRAGRDRHRG